MKVKNNQHKRKKQAILSALFLGISAIDFSGLNIVQAEEGEQIIPLSTQSGILIGTGHPRHEITSRISDAEWDIVSNLQGWGSSSQSNYTAASWQQMQDALTQARQLQVADWQLNLSHQELTAMYSLLRNGLNGLVPIGSNPLPPLPPAAVREGYVTVNLNLRQGPGTQYGIIRTLPAQTAVTILNEQNGWMRVQAGNNEGWVSAQFVRIGTPPSQTPPPNAPVQAGHTVANLNLRRGAGTQYGIIRTLPIGTAVTILSEQNGWMRVQAGNDEGFVSSQFVRLGAAPQVPIAPPAQNRTGSTTHALNLRRGAGTNYGVIIVLSQGAPVTILSEDNGWMHIRAAGQEGFVSAQFIREGNTAPAPPASTRQGQTTVNLNLRMGAGTQHALIRTLPQGTSVTIFSESNGWMHVQAGNTEGFVSAQFIQ